MGIMKCPELAYPGLDRYRSCTVLVFQLTRPLAFVRLRVELSTRYSSLRISASVITGEAGTSRNVYAGGKPGADLADRCIFRVLGMAWLPSSRP